MTCAKTIIPNNYPYYPNYWVGRVDQQYRKNAFLQHVYGSTRKRMIKNDLLIHIRNQDQRQLIISSIIDPRGRPTVTAGSDHTLFTSGVCTSRPSFTFHKLAKQKKFQVRIVIPSTCRIVGLVEWIIDGTHKLPRETCNLTT